MLFSVQRCGAGLVMQTIEYRVIDKSTYGSGEWSDEPDKIQWQDEVTGFPCLIVRNRSEGFLCGDVGVPDSHPLFGREYNDDWRIEELQVHGGEFQ